MKTQWMLAASLVAAVALAQQDQRKERAIEVQVTDRQVVVAEEVDTSEDEGALVWRLSQKEFSFPDNGIVFDAQGKAKHNCRVIEGGRAVRCAKLKHVHDARYKYTVNVIDAGSQQPLPPRDPWIHNT